METDTTLLVTALTWMVINAALPTIAFTCRSFVWKTIFGTSAMLVPVAGALVVVGGHSPEVGAWWLPTLVGLSGFLSNGLVAIAFSFARRTPFAFRVLAGGSTSLVAATLVWSVASVENAQASAPKEWKAADAAIAKIVSEKVPALVEDNFSISAVDGAFLSEPQTAQPIHELALFIFSQRLGGALQPLLNIRGVQVGVFRADPRSVQIVPVQAPDGTHHFRLRGALHLEYLFLAPASEGKPGVERRFADDIAIVLNGVFDPATDAVRLDFAELLPPSPPSP